MAMRSSARGEKERAREEEEEKKKKERREIIGASDEKTNKWKRKKGVRWMGWDGIGTWDSAEKTRKGGSKEGKTRGQEKKEEKRELSVGLCADEDGDPLFPFFPLSLSLSSSLPFMVPLPFQSLSMHGPFTRTSEWTLQGSLVSSPSQPGPSFLSSLVRCSLSAGCALFVSRMPTFPPLSARVAVQSCGMGCDGKRTL